MDTLSRREEETLAKTTKEQALKECDPVVKGPLPMIHLCSSLDDSVVAFAECATGRILSVAWACRDKYKAVQECMVIQSVYFLFAFHSS